MPVPTHFRFTFRGDYVGTPEHWSFGLHYQRTVDNFTDATLDDIDKGAVTTACDTFFAGNEAGIPPAAKMTDWRAYTIAPTGLAEGPIHVEDVSELDITGIGANRYPPQVALCITKVADNRGPAKLGRFYLPTNLALESDLRLSVTTATNVGILVGNFLKGISDAIDLPGVVNSSAAINVSSVGAGTRQDVDHLEVGRVLDTLRSRRRSMLEERVVGGQIDW